MKKYKYNSKSKKDRKEQLGFVTAFTVCIIAIGLAIGSTYASIGGLDGNLSGGDSGYTATLAAGSKEVDNELSGVTVIPTEETEALTTSEAVPQTDAQSVTETAASDSDAVDAPLTKEEKLQTILQVPTSLLYPTASERVTKEYSEQAVYSETLEDYRPHTGTDFAAEKGEAVFSVCDGIVDDIYYDDMFGNVIKIANGNYSVYYCGVGDDMAVKEGEEVTSTQVIAQVGDIPCESSDAGHIHMEVRVSGNSIDPMTVISNDK